MTSKMLRPPAETIVVTELKSTLRNSSHLSASSRRSEDVKMLRVALFTERGRFIKNAFILKAASSSLTRRRS